MIPTQNEALAARAYAKEFCTNYPGQGSNFVVIYEAFLAGMEWRKKRRKYIWGRFDEMKAMEPGEVKMLEEGNADEARAFRVMANRLWHDYRAEYSIHYEKGKIYATRLR